MNVVPEREREGQREVMAGRRSTDWTKFPFLIGMPTTGPSAGPPDLQETDSASCFMGSRSPQVGGLGGPPAHC